jgi:radical SAM superfamily enzyme
LIAFQSLDPKTLKAIKRANIKLNVFFELQAKFMKDGIKTFSDIILGLPEETYDSFTEGVGKLVSMGQHNRIQFNNLSILPNTEMGDPEYLEKYEMKIVENDIINIHGALGEWLDDIYETQQMVVGTKSMPGEEWVKTRVFGYVVAFLHFNKLFQIPIIIANRC